MAKPTMLPAKLPRYWAYCALCNFTWEARGTLGDCPICGGLKRIKVTVKRAGSDGWSR